MYITLANGIKVFYRSAGPKDAPVVLLLHGFPASSFQYRNLTPILASKYRVIAPDFPGFGFTEVPASLNFPYTFANLTDTLAAFLSALDITKFSVYIFDYGAPTALRLALQLPPNSISAIITQNGNAYTDGLGKFWEPLRAYWAAADPTSYRADLAAAALTPEAVREQYTLGEPDADSSIDPVSYTLDSALLARPGNADIQLDLFYDYRTNVDLYPNFQHWFRTSQVPLLAVWGKNDIIFVPPGAEAFRNDLPHAEIEFLDAGHFAVESNAQKIGERILKFFQEKGI